MSTKQETRKTLSGKRIPVDPSAEPNPIQLAILRGLQSKHVYAGTVPDKDKASRRAANKVARLSRRVNRGR